MTYCGHVKNGMVVLDGSVSLPEGALVEVALVENGSPPVEGPSAGDVANPALMRYAGAARDLPPDAARNLDDYLYGRRER